MRPETIEFTCTVCGEEKVQEFSGDLLVIEEGHETPSIICDECFEHIQMGVCGKVRRNYACLRPPDHEPATAHASVDGKFWVLWTDSSLGVTLRLR